MDDYQMIQQRGVQELVAVSRDEEDLPCIYLSAIDSIFPNANVVSSYGVRVPFSTNRSGVPKQPLRIPYFENRVLDVECDNSSLEWSREATAARIAAVAAAAAHLIPPNTVHTAPLVSITDLDLDLYSYSDDDNDISHNTRIPARSRSSDLDSDDNFDMIESDHSSDEDNENAEDEDGDGDVNDETLSSPNRSTRFTPPPQRTMTASSTSSTTGQLASTTQSFERLRVGLQPIPETNPFVRDLPPSFNTVVSPPIQTTVALPPSVVATPTVPFLPAARHAIPEESLTNGDAAPPPTYEPIDTLAHDITGPGPVTNHVTGASESHFVPPPTIDDPSERHLVHDRVEIIKRISQTILNQKYESEVCAHPPLFVILPENPLRWSFDNLLHNKMRLYFLCDCCEHEGFVPRGNSTGERRGLRNQRNVHVTGGKGFEIRMDQFQDQMLIAKFGHYILHLLRMLQFGVSLDDHFVASAFDRPVPLISASGTNLGGLDPELYFKLRKNVERSIAFMEALLGDDYEEEAIEAVMRLDLNDFRILDHIVKRQPYSQPASASKVLPSSASVASISSTSSPPTSPTTAAAAPRAELAQPLGSSLFDGGNGLYKVLGPDSRVRWSCENFYGKHHQTLDKVFSTKLNFLQVDMDTHVRSAEMTGTSENILNTRVIAVSKIRALFRIDLNFDWDFENDKLVTVTNMLKQDAASVSTLAVRFSRKVPPLTWRQHLVSYGEDAQPMIAVLNLVKNRKLKHLILEGDVDLFSVPNLGTMDFSNLDILSIMKTNHRGYGHTAALLRNNKTNNSYNNSSAASVRSLDGYDNGERGTAKTYTQENYIPELLSFLQTCSLLTEISLGFPDVVPGHIRILQTCIAGLSRLARVDLFRIVGSSLSGSANSSTSSSNSPAAGNKRPILNKKLELSANVSASRITRLYLSECKVVGDGRARLLESLEEVLMDYGPSLEDLEIKFVGFNDKHAHALEYGTRPQSDQTSCRLRRLVLHGKGLETGGVAALKRVIGRATRSKPQESIVVGNTRGTLGRSTSRRGGSVATELTVAIAAAAPSAGSGLESLSFGTMLDEPTLTHLELCSIDTLADSDWAHLVSELNMKRLITLEVQGVWVGDRTVAMLARCGQNEDIVDEPSSPHSPAEDFSSSLPPAPPAFFSASAPLPLQTLRIHCSSLTNKGVMHFREFLSRLIHLSTLSLHGFRKVGSDHWVDMLSRIEFRWVEIIEIVSSGFDDYCGEYLGERIQARSQLPDFVATLSPAEAYDTEGPALPAYSAQAPAATSPTTTISSSSSNALSSSPPLSTAASPTRRDSLSSRLRASISNTSRPKDPEPKPTPIPSSTSTTSLTRPTASQKYLEVDLRYTDVSAKGLALLRTKVLGQAKRVVVMSRDGEEEEEVDEGEADKEAARLAQKRMAEKESEAKWSAKGGSPSSSSSSPSNGRGASHSGGGGTFSALAYSLSSASQGSSNRNGGSNGSSSNHGNSSNGTSQSQHQQQGSGQTTRSTFSTVKRFLTKK